MEASVPEDNDFNSVNERPSVDNPARIPFLARVRLERIWTEYLKYLSGENE